MLRAHLAHWRVGCVYVTQQVQTIPVLLRGDPMSEFGGPIGNALVGDQPLVQRPGGGEERGGDGHDKADGLRLIGDALQLGVVRRDRVDDPTRDEQENGDKDTATTKVQMSRPSRARRRCLSRIAGILPEQRYEPIGCEYGKESRSAVAVSPVAAEMT